MGMYVVGGIGIVSVLVFVCMALWLGTLSEHKKQEAAAMLEQQAHEERLAMIERGMTPPTETPQLREKNMNTVYGVLGTIGGLTPFFASLNGSAIAWAAAGVVGVAAVIALVTIYLKNASLNAR